MTKMMKYIYTEEEGEREEEIEKEKQTDWERDVWNFAQKSNEKGKKTTKTGKQTGAGVRYRIMQIVVLVVPTDRPDALQRFLAPNLAG